jgi:hypothetical protein
MYQITETIGLTDSLVGVDFALITSRLQSLIGDDGADALDAIRTIVGCREPSDTLADLIGYYRDAAAEWAAEVASEQERRSHASHSARAEYDV